MGVYAVNNSLVLKISHRFQQIKSLSLWRYMLVALMAFWAAALSAGVHAVEEAPPHRHLENREHGGFEIRRQQPADAFEALPMDAVLLSSHIEVEITGFIARTTLKQRFRNTTNDWVEGTYRFPLMSGAAVDALVMQVGDRRIVGKIKEKEEAKRIYERAIREGKKAAILNQARPNMFTSKVGNVAPGSEIAVEISFISLAKQNGLAFSWHMPQAITPRYGAAGQMEDAGDRPLPAGRAHYDLASEGGATRNPTSFSIKLNAGTDVSALSSPTHDIAVAAHEGGRFDISLRDGSLPADRDFALRWSLEAGTSAKPVLFQEQLEGERYLLGFLLPPTEEAQTAVVPPRDVTFVMDISGSMAGSSIRQAKIALLRALDLLRPEDRFDIVLFNNDYMRLFGESRLASQDNLMIARNLVRRTDANGGTEMKGALTSALSDGHDPESLRQILFLTDGAVGYENEMFSLVNRELGQARLFTVGLGSAPDGWFMRKAAEFGRGLYVKVDDVSEAQTSLEALYSAMAKPSVSAIELETGEGAESFPARMPDLFGDRPAVFVTKLPKRAKRVTLSGLSRGGSMWSAPIWVADVPEGEGISKLWARKKVEHLMDEQVRGRPQREIKPLVLETALKHGIMSTYTSFVAVEDKESRQQAEALKQARLKGNLPKGTVAQKFFAPSTATPMMVKLLLGALLLGAGFVLLVLLRLRQLKQGLFSGAR